MRPWLSSRECVRLDPHEKLGAGVFLAALTGEDAAPESSQAYVRNLFDQYAERYDAHLVNKLDYQGPAGDQIIAGRMAFAFGRAADSGSRLRHRTVRSCAASVRR